MTSRRWKKRALAFATLSACTAAAVAVPYRAQAVPMPMRAHEQQSASISRALEIYVTRRGQKYFNKNLSDLLYRDGFDLSAGGFDGWKYESQEPIDLNHLPVHMQAFSGTLGTVRDILNRWFMNMSLQNPRIQAQVADIEYSATVKKLGLRIDQDATTRLTGGHGVVVVFEAEVPQIRLQAETVRASDTANHLDFGADHVWAGIQAHSQPLRIQVPMSVQLNSQGNAEFKVLDVATNLRDVDLDMGFDRPLQLPKASIIINGHRSTLKQDELERQLLQRKPELLKALQSYLAQYAVENAPSVANSWFAAKYPRPMTDINEMDPPGAGTNVGPGERYQWGIKPEAIEVNRDYVMVGLSAFVDDPKSSQPGAEVSRRLTTHAPALNLINPSNYDAALVLNEDLINRILGLGFRRGYYKTLEVAQGQVLRILQAPEFRFDGSKNSDQGKLYVKVSQAVAGFSQKVAIRQQLTFTMALNARLVHSRDGKVSVAVDRADLDSIDQSTVRAGFHNAVAKRVQERLDATNNELRSKPKVVVDRLPIPSQIAGIPLRIKDFRSDPNGYLVLYFEYNFGN